MTRSTLRRRVFVTSVVLPLVLALVGIVLILTWLPTLPVSVIVHWGIDGADGFAPAWTYLVILAGVAVLTAGVFGSVLLATVQSGALSLQQKILAVVSPTVLIFVTSVLLALLGGQRDAGQPRVAIALLASLALAAGGGAAVWASLPKSSERGSAGGGAAVSPLLLAANERAVWMRRASASTLLIVLLSVLTVVLVVIVAIAAVTTSPAVWWFQLIPVLVLVGTVTSLVFRVRVDENGLTARGLAGFPRFSVPLDQVESASVVRINPLVDFGGWGIRIGVGGPDGRSRVGVILRTGEALEVLRHDGRSLVVTVDDAEGAAALLTSLSARAAHPA